MLANQFGVLPYRTSSEGSIEVMLITSRNTRRWVIPRGNPIGGLLPHLSAAREAYEEAGVIGHISEEAIGSYKYLKVLKGGGGRPTRVYVFPLTVATQLATWVESGQRNTRWFSLAKASKAVRERGLRRLIEQLGDRVG